MSKRPNAEQRVMAAIYRHHVHRSEIKPVIESVFPGARFTLRSIGFQDLARDSVQEVVVETPESFFDLHSRRGWLRVELKKIEPTLQVRFKGDIFS